MSNISLKEQLQAVASQFSDPSKKASQKKQKVHSVERSNDRANERSPERLNERSHERSHDRSKKPKPKWLDYVQYGVELLKVYLPQAFKSVNEVKPLKKGIKQDLVKHLSTVAEIVTEDKACMVKSLAYYVNTAAYHRSVVTGAVRIDLNGNPAGVVTEEEAKYSNERYQAKLKAKKSKEAKET